ncbi:DNA-binding protein [Massilia sp.]|uniref:DNA-binding protein n=1 Tax=Massilia sp. TaxID=1882437 RepID=UPI002896DA21|nr:DNA-binding protein [Massilia sp.]
MGRKAALSYEQVKAVVNALRAEGAKPTIDKVWGALDRAGSKGTIHKLVKQYMAELEGAQQTPESLRLLPHDIQQVILAFADQAASTAREKIADELVECRQEGDNLASDNERLSAEVDALRVQLAQAASERAAAEGRAVQLENELAAARTHANDERAAAERARTALARAELQLESISHLEDALRGMRTELEGQREARIEAERTVAVQVAQRKDQEERMRDLKSELSAVREACLQREGRNADLSQAFERERQAREVAERDLAVRIAVQAGLTLAAPKKEKDVRQRALWPQDRELPGR